MTSASIRIRSRSEIERATWDTFVDSSDECWLWHRSDLIDAVGLWPGHSDASFALVDRRDSLLAIMPMHRTVTRVAHLARCVRLNSLGGPACAANLAPAERAKVLSNLHDHLLNLIAESNAIALEAQISTLAPRFNGPAAPKVNPLIDIGFDNTQTETWMVDLTATPEDLCKRYSELTRRELRKASQAEIRVREAKGPKDLDTYYRLHLETYARTGARPHPIGYFQTIFEKFQPLGLARILFAERRGEVVAAQNTGLYKGGAIYWTGASISEKEGGENRVLFNAQILAARADGLTRYETGQAFVNSNDKKERGLSRFKRSFGAEMYPFYRGVLLSSRLPYRALWNLREMIRSIWS